MIDVGIVMPVYKQDSNLFIKAIKSIRKQKYKNFRLIIVIDGVTDNVLQIAQLFARRDKRIKVIPRKQNKGTATALNIGFEILQKQESIKYLTWVSSDNYYYPNFVGVLRNKLKNSPPNVGLAYGSFNFIKDGKRINSTDTWLIWQNQPKEKLVDFYFIGYSFMYKKEYAKKIEGWKYTPVEDYDYFLRLTEICDIVYVPKILMDFLLTTPYSNSMQIEKSLEKKRYRRYVMYHVMHQARLRRNIKPLITIIMYAKDTTTALTERLESLLEQTFSNYKLLIYDVSPSQGVLQIINDNPDSRTNYFWIPNGTLVDVINESMPIVDTPYFMFYDTDSKFENVQHLEQLSNSATSNPPSKFSSSVSPTFLQLYQK